MSVPDPFAFYTALPVCPSFTDVTRPEVYAALPDDWVIIIGDVQGSTAAIARGQYKDVNLVGSSLLIATFNTLGRSDIPFVFGGDGATLAVPESELARVTPALLATRRMARDGFDLDLRVGIVPMRDIRAAGHDALVARVRLAEKFSLAAFWGGGLGWAERMVKDAQAGSTYWLEGDAEPGPDTFAGLECRWRGVPSERGETLALLVQATASNDAQRVRVYVEVVKKLREVFGETAGHPVAISQLQLAGDPAAFRGETKVHLSQAGPLRRALFQLKVRLGTALGGFFMRHRLKIGKIDWSKYTQDVVQHSDFRKFDGVLRMILSATPAQREELTNWLDKRYRAGELAYGVHIAKEALVTCLIFEREGGHIHFIDGAGGGYALAATDLKARLAAQLPAA